MRFALISSVIISSLSVFAPYESAAQPAKKPHPQYLDLELGKGINLNLIRIDPGKFKMGRERDRDAPTADDAQHEVQLTKTFYMGIHELTQGQFKAVMGWNPSHYRSPDLPVETVSWHDAVEFCNRLSKSSRKTIDLPTEAEWEYACRAGTTTKYYWGETLSRDQANFGWWVLFPNVDEKPRGTLKVGSFRPNGFGLYDMHGNVGEWCKDWYAPYDKKSAKDPTGPESGSLPVVRGGSFMLPPEEAQSASRRSLIPQIESPAVGFRVVLRLP